MNSIEDIIIVGYGGHAKSIADCIERTNKYKIVGYTDVQARESIYPYLGTDDILYNYYNSGIRNAVIGLGYMGKGNIRELLYNKLKKIGFNLPVIYDPSSIISSTAIIGEGVFVGKYAIVNAEAVIEKMAIVNTKALIEHECVVGEYSHVAVAAVLCGQVNVGKSCLIGANATVIQGISIESHSIIPAGSTVR